MTLTALEKLGTIGYKKRKKFKNQMLKCNCGKLMIMN